MMIRYRLLSAALAACSLLPAGAEADTHMALSRVQELRYWSEPSKPEARRGAVLSPFKHAHPCPANGARVGSCPRTYHIYLSF